jgi:hypothetical protein
VLLYRTNLLHPIAISKTCRSSIRHCSTDPSHSGLTYLSDTWSLACQWLSRGIDLSFNPVTHLGKKELRVC